MGFVINIMSILKNINMTTYKKPNITLAPTLDGHWYYVDGKGPYPSVTTILRAYPQSEHLQRWIAEKGWNESQKIKSKAGEEGTAIHSAIERLIKGEELEQTFYSLKEWHKICSFVTWYKDWQPKITYVEVTVFSKKYKYTGTVDMCADINGVKYLIDNKSSGSIHSHFHLQTAAYANALQEMKIWDSDQTAILQLGASNQLGYRFVCEKNWKDDFKVFLSVKKTFEYDRGNVVPPVLVLPNKLKL